MKTMTQEEKAKAYDESLEKAKQVYNDCICCRKCLNELFPVLAESEDERIRKEMLQIAKESEDSFYMVLTPNKRETLIAWLEKQGEKKPVNNVEPKFKVGDWVVSPNGVYWHIDAIQNGRYEVTADTGQCGNWPLDTNIYRLWTIQDAKDGDVLYDGDNACLFRKKIEDDDAIWVDTYCGTNSDGMFNVNDEDECWCFACDCVPATKEQRDTLMKMMADAGYEFDFDKKELRKIGHKQNWSEEDEDYFDAIIVKLEVTQEDAALTDNQMNFLKSLKNRIQLQLKQEWGEEDESRITTICTYLQDYARLSGSESRTIRINEYCDWLKSLKDRCLPQQQHEWSEEDECNMRRIIRVLEDNDSDWDALTAWLKSLNPQSRWKPSEQEKAALRTAIYIMTKERSFPLLGAHLQNILDAFEGESRVDWKPSKGQMEALKEACNEHYNPKGELYSLYEQLKAL